IFLGALRDWAHGTPKTVSEIYAEIEANGSDLAPLLPRQLAERLNSAKGPFAARSRLGVAFSQLIDRRFDGDGLRLEKAGQDRTKAGLWQVRVDREHFA